MLRSQNTFLWYSYKMKKILSIFTLLAWLITFLSKLCSRLLETVSSFLCGWGAFGHHIPTSSDGALRHRPPAWLRPLVSLRTKRAGEGFLLAKEWVIRRPVQNHPDLHQRQYLSAITVPFCTNDHMKWYFLIDTRSCGELTLTTPLIRLCGTFLQRKTPARKNLYISIQII